tara:strand:- start:103 stop:327 length:225 start_codon:yes stop_codon:yes gene_type:complete
VICIGEIECGDGDGQAAGITIQIGNGIGMVDITIGVLGISIRGMVIGAQVIGIGISGTILGKTIHMYMDQELVI